MLFTERMLPGIRTHKRKNKKENVKSTSACYHQVCQPWGLTVLHPTLLRFFFLFVFFNSKLFFTFLLITLSF